MAVTPTADRILSLDVLRGFALLGVLLLNIVGFGMVSTAYSNPPSGFIHAADAMVWAGIDLVAEGAMRCLFSILFGAGVVLFITGAAGNRSFDRVAAHHRGLLHHRRCFWLLLFGLFDAYVLLWSGDILITYALAGMALYWVRNTSARLLLTAAIALIVLMSLMHAATASWASVADDFTLSAQEVAAELAARQHSYGSAFLWNVAKATEMLTVVLPFVLFWDALAMMLLGMSLYKCGVLQGQRSRAFYVWLMVTGFVSGLLINSYEVYNAVTMDYAFVSVFAQAQPSYHVGRLGVALGYLGLIMLLLRHGVMARLRDGMAAVGQMALTNYLMHSLLGLLIFTGAGLGLVGELYRWQLYGVVLGIWILQLWFSPWWLARYRFGPAEWLWRGLTYGRWPPLRG